VTLVAHDQMPEVPQPGKEALDFPATPTAAERTAVLGLGPGAATSMGGDHLDAQLSKRLVQGIRIVGAVTNEALRQLVYKTGVEGGSNERDFVR
jgi:hypothetical protein